MCARETLFISSVVFTGPIIGKMLNSDNKATPFTTYVGRMVSGVFTTVLSQPFDCLARELQIQRFNKQPMKISDCMRKMQAEYVSLKLKPYQHPLFKGTMPRLFLSTQGGAIAGGLFDYFKKQYDE